MTEQSQATPQPSTPTDAPAVVAPQAPPASTPTAPTEKPDAKGGKDAILADLARERDKRQALEQRFTDQQDAFAKALGLKPGEVSDTEKLAATVGTLQQQILGAERRALAAEFKVPEAMLTATDADSMRQQATQLVEFAQAAHYAAATSAPPTPPPAFQQNPGQGQGGAPMTPEAQAMAEYEKFYPPVSRR